MKIHFKLVPALKIISELGGIPVLILTPGLRGLSPGVRIHTLIPLTTAAAQFYRNLVHLPAARARSVMAEWACRGVSRGEEGAT